MVYMYLDRARAHIACWSLLFLYRHILHVNVAVIRRYGRRFEYCLCWYPRRCPHLQLLMCHSGFQQLYEQESREGLESPKQTVNRMVETHKGTIEKVTVVGHSLGAGKHLTARV